EKRWGKKGPIAPSPFDEPTPTAEAKRPAANPAPKRNPKVEDLTKAAELAVSDDQTRFVLMEVLSDSGFSVATDGRVMTVVAGGGGLTNAEINKKHGMKKDFRGYPDWRRVSPGWLKFEDGAIR